MKAMQVMPMDWKTSQLLYRVAYLICIEGVERTGVFSTHLNPYDKRELATIAEQIASTYPHLKFPITVQLFESKVGSGPLDAMVVNLHMVPVFQVDMTQAQSAWEQQKAFDNA